MAKKQTVSTLAIKAFLDFAFEMHSKGFYISHIVRASLERNMYFESQQPKEKKLKLKSKKFELTDEEKKNALLKKLAKRKSNHFMPPPTHYKKTDAQKEIDKDVMIIIKPRLDDNADSNAAISELQDKYEIGAEELQQFEKQGLIVHPEDERELKKWKIPIEDIYNHDMEFYSWINSINSGFQNRINYWRFDRYKEQSESWLRNAQPISNYRGTEERRNFVKSNILMCKENSLYYLNKWHKYKANTPSGFKPYRSEAAQEIFSFLVDSKYDILLAKARQIWLTTTAFGIALKNTYMNKSFGSIIVSADTTKAEKTFADKIVSPYYGLEDYMKPSKPSTDRKTELGFYKDKKTESGASSTISILPPSANAFNSSSLDQAWVDEIGLVDCLVEMVEDWRPTKFQFDWETGKQYPKSQMVLWGTSDKVKFPEFEDYYTREIKRWSDREFELGFVPVFFNCMARPGYTMKRYEIEKSVAYRQEGTKRQIVITKFHQGNPFTIEDMFIGEADTIIPMQEIQSHIKRINTSEPTERAVYGWFEPVYDRTRPTSDEYGYKIIDSVFVKAENLSDHRITSIMYREPVRGWKNRYYKGTDPIMNASGTSNFASGIWDKELNELSCLLNYRDPNHRYCFLQSFLMMLYYGQDTPDLIENNIGQPYIDFVTLMGYTKNLVPNSALPLELQSSADTNPIGINKRRGNVPRNLTHYNVKMIDLYGKNINIETVWTQYKTYIRKKNVNIADDNLFKTSNPSVYKDDAIDGTLYAYINANSYMAKTPVNTKEVVKNDISKKMRLTYDKNWNVIMVNESNYVKNIEAGN